MANLNRENLITVDMKNATISNTAGNMTFYITDKKTSNIFCKLAINESESNDFAEDDDFIPIENALDYKITLRVVKPNHEPKELEFTLLNEKQAIFMVDLPDDYKDRAGTYKCELLIESNTEKESGAVIEPEAVTTNSFTYTVNKSVFNDLDNIIDDGSDNPLINILATKEYVEDLILVIDKQYITADDFPMGSSTCKLTGTIVINGTSGGDLTNFSNQLVYAQKVKGIGGLNFLNICTMDNKYFRFDFNESSVKLYEYEYITKEYMAEELENLTQGIATVDYVDESIAAIPDTDLLINYTTNSDVINMIQKYNDTIVAQDFASKSYVNNMMLSMDQKIEKAGYTTESFVNEEISKLSANIGNILTNNYATKSEMNTAINEALGGTDLSDYATKSYVNEAINNKTSYYDMRYATTSYVDTEVDEVFNYCASVRTILQNVIDEYADKNYVDTAIANAITPDLSDYATHTYVSNFFNNSINSRLEEYATKDYVGDEIRELSRSMLNYSDIKDYMADYLWVNEYTTKDYVATEIANAQLGGGEGGSVDLSGYATKEYVDTEVGSLYSEMSDNYATKDYVHTYIDENCSTPDLTGYATENYVRDQVDNLLNEGLPARGYMTQTKADTLYATKEELDNVIHVINKSVIGFDDLPTGKSTCKLNGSLLIIGNNGDTLMNSDFIDEIVRIEKTDSDSIRFFKLYTLDNRYIFCHLNGTVEEHEYETKYFVDLKISNALGDIETLLGEI